MESYQFSKDQEDEIKVSVFAFWRKAEKKTENCFDSQKVSASPPSVPSLFQMSNSHFSLKGAGSFTQLVKVRRVPWFWNFRASDLHETFTRSSLALNMSKKLFSDP